MKYILFLLLLGNYLFANKFYYEFDKKVEIKNQLQTQNLKTKNDILQYQTTTGKNIKFKNEIIVQCKINAYCEDDFSDLSIIDYEKVIDNLYLIKLTKNQDIFDLAQKLYLKDDIRSAHPNYVKAREKR